MTTGARHEGRPGWRYSFLGPTECGKTTTMIRYIMAWLEQFKDGIVYTNFHIYDGMIDPTKTPDVKRIPHPRVRIIRDFARVKTLTGKRFPVLLAMDEFGKYLNSLQGWTSNDILKIQLDIASNLMKQDLELCYTDQWPKNLHVRVRMNVNRVFLPTYEEARGVVEYFTWPSIDDYLARDELKRQGPVSFIAKDWFRFFDTKEIISPKLPKFNPEREVDIIRKWAKREEVPIPEGRAISDFISYYQTKRNLTWGRHQIGAVRFILMNEVRTSEASSSKKSNQQPNKTEEGKKGKEKDD